MITFSATTILVLALIVALIVVVAGWAYATANRLDRLHVRSDQARDALEAALSRRAVVARGVSLALGGAGHAVEGTDSAGDPARQLQALADRAERVDWSEREHAENRLAAALSTIDAASLAPQLVAELADAEARVLIARRFHNDAVRDTLALRTRRPVRLLHLGGTAPLPTYFEITERVTPAATTGLEVDTVRTSARVVLLDECDRVLLLRGHDPQTPDVPFWFTVGGGMELGESLRAAAIRELWEETGRAVDSSALRGPIWRRVAVFTFDGQLVRSEELFFVVRTATFEPKAAEPTPMEQQIVTDSKWCVAEDIRALEVAGETVYPDHLDQLLAEAVAVAGGDSDPEVRSIR